MTLDLMAVTIETVGSSR